MNTEQEPPNLIVPDDLLKFVANHPWLHIEFTWIECGYCPMIVNEKGEGPIIPLCHEDPVAPKETYILVCPSRCYYGGPSPMISEGEFSSLTSAIKVAATTRHALGFDVYRKSPTVGTAALSPVWSYSNKASYEDAIEQLDPFHDGGS